MTAKQAILILAKHNKWRRGETGKQQKPEVIGEVIDVCLVLLRDMVKRENINQY